MSLPFKITDETDDRKYFAIIPYLIINHSDHWEQSLYLQMKRFAGEKGTNTCFATQETLGKAMKVSQPIVSRTLKKLIKRGWIELLGTRPGKTHPVAEYKIIDLWQLNIEFYSKKKQKKITEPQNKSPQKQKDSQTTEYKKYSVNRLEEETYIKKNNNNTAVLYAPQKISNGLNLSRSQVIAFLKEFPGIKTSELKEQASECNRYMAMSSQNYANVGLFFRGWLKKYYKEKQSKEALEKKSREILASCPEISEEQRLKNLEKLKEMKETLKKVMSI